MGRYRYRVSLAASALTILATLVASLGQGATGRAHDFEETRRMVLSIEEGHVDLLVAYEARPGARADALIARFDQNGDGLATRDLERLTRARVIAPRLRRGVRFHVDGAVLRFNLETLEFPAPPREGGKNGIAAMALYRAELSRAPTASNPLELTIRGRGEIGGVTLEAQASEALEIIAPTLPGRPNDPVLGPAALAVASETTLTVSPR